MEIYVHRSGKERIELREVEESVTVAEATGAGEDEKVWIEDVEETIDLTGTLTEAGVPHRGHVHVNRCHRVDVDVRFNGVTKEQDFPPSATIKRVTEWAAGERGFDLSKEDRAEHILQLCGTDDQPDETDHVGSFVSETYCEVCFDLVPKHRIEG